ncbi:ubiquinol oxidase subunit II [Phytohalomonas tamaricis]|uniref:ubiquinol oxidase subunit II n=1 Tax=Phytohalomonas tamaricis TaxID=2081032 RepID=UPI000D0BB791|nr:ubiquinol oxidase subunit II [Phytohalomonas tamaricis]
MRQKNYLGCVKKLALCATVLLLSGCDSMVLMNSKGQVGAEQKYLILTSTWLMLIVVIPAILMTLIFAWKYRASNKQAKYSPNWSHSNKVEAVVWGIPCLIIVALATLTWKSTHALDPHKPIDSDVAPINIQVVALDWKWLFIYPDQGIATINQIAFPKDVPVNFQVTSNSVMNSFFIPQLGSQIYAMAGMQNSVHLMANEAGTYGGMSANYSGHGFSDMTFTALAMNSPQEFDEWVNKVKASSETLGRNEFEKVAEPSQKNPVEYFSSVEPHLFQNIIDKFAKSMGMAGTGE